MARFLEFVYSQFGDWERYKVADDILQKRFKSACNDNLLLVYEKVALLDRLYGTNIFDAFKLAQHIVASKIDPLLRTGDPKIVSKIGAGHKIKAKNGRKEKTLYSFATKYASWHRPDAYPIYDTLIGRLLPKLNQRFQFYDGRISQKRLRTYKNLVTAIDSLTEAVELKHLRYKTIDKALWLWAKYEFRRKQVIPGIKQRIAEEKRRRKIRL